MTPGRTGGFMKPNGYECFECGIVVEDDTVDPDNDSPDCWQCLDQGAEDPNCTRLVRITPCKKKNPKKCKSDFHHHGMNKHIKAT